MNLNRIKKYTLTHRFFLRVFVFLVLFSIVFQRSWAPMKEAPGQLINDVDQYYSYLPAAFIHQDLSFKFPNEYWLIENQHKVKLPKVTMGLSYMYLPFFLIGHSIANRADYKANGYSAPYSTSMGIGSFLYVCLSLFFLYHSLLFYFSKQTATITVASIFLGTNLFYYSVNYGMMPHGHLFLVFLSSFILHLSSLKPKNLSTYTA